MITTKNIWDNYRRSHYFPHCSPSDVKSSNFRLPDKEWRWLEWVFRGSWSFQQKSRLLFFFIRLSSVLWTFSSDAPLVSTAVKIKHVNRLRKVQSSSQFITWNCLPHFLCSASLFFAFKCPFSALNAFVVELPMFFSSRSLCALKKFTIFGWLERRNFLWQRKMGQSERVYVHTLSSTADRK